MPDLGQIGESYIVFCVDITPAEISFAFQNEDTAKIGFWDGLIIASAHRGRARCLAKDLDAGRLIVGIRVENPFIS
jgi:predicted nucleic acid-binding protein